MKKFKVLLSRNYIVTIEAENEENAKIYSKYFISGVYDISSNEETKKP